MPKLVKLKVKPRKADITNPCVPQLTEMLACWAVSSGPNRDQMCANTAKALAECMRGSSGSRKVNSSTINYHLARLGKQLVR